MFIGIVLLLFGVSVLLSVVSLRAELKKNIKTEQVTKELATGRVIFQANSQSGGEIKDKENTIT